MYWCIRHLMIIILYLLKDERKKNWNKHLLLLWVLASGLCFCMRACVCVYLCVFVYLRESTKKEFSAGISTYTASCICVVVCLCIGTLICMIQIIHISISIECRIWNPVLNLNIDPYHFQNDISWSVFILHKFFFADLKHSS